MFIFVCTEKLDGKCEFISNPEVLCLHRTEFMNKWHHVAAVASEYWNANDVMLIICMTSSAIVIG